MAGNVHWIKFLMLLPAALFLVASPVHRPAHGAACPPGIPCTLGYMPGSGANDNKVESGSNACDGDFMNQIYAKAFLEAEREMVVNKTIIRKPDSVLEYTCFDDFVGMAAQTGGEIFSNTSDWRGRTVEILGLGSVSVPIPTVMLTDMDMLGDKLDLSLELLVLRSLEQYVDDNFGHDFLGGTAGIDSNISASIGPNNYTCDHMNRVWDIMKCDNFGSEIDFISFEDLAADDPRNWPEECGGTAITPEIVQVAQNENWTYAAGPDPVDPFFTLLRPPGGSVSCGEPVPTGVRIKRYEWGAGFSIPGIFSTFLNRSSDTYDDKVCPNPSCYYDWDSDRCRN